jgi:hypothetical protein
MSSRHQRRKKAAIKKAKLTQEKIAGMNAVKVRKIVQGNLSSPYKTKGSPVKQISSVYSGNFAARALGGNRPLFSTPNDQVKR